MAVSSSMVAGGSQQLQAAVTDATGKLIRTATVTWSVTPNTVATVSATGVLTAVATGTVKVTAKSGSSTTTVDIDVISNPCTTPVTLAVGEVRAFTGAATVACVTLAATSGASDFLVIGSNVRPTQDDLLTYTMSTGGTTAAISPSTALQHADLGTILEAREGARVEAVHERLRAAERRLVSPMMRSVAVRNAAQRGSELQPSRSIAAAVQAVGDTVTIRVPNLQSGKDICRDAVVVRGVVRVVSARSTIVEDISSPAGGFSTTDFAAIAQEFDDVIFPVDTAWFGKPTDINTDGRITILYTPEVNKLAPPNAQGFTAGFFFGNDLLRKTDFPSATDCRTATNEQEIFYLLAPDPAGLFNNVRTTTTVRQSTRGVIAHEFQHMLNQGVRQYNPAVEALEVSWLNEAMSHLAEEAVGRAVRGFGDFQSLSYNDVNPNITSANEYNAFFRQNLLRLRSWMQRPDTAAPVSNKNRDQLAPRGASWSLLRYTIDQYSNGAARAFTRALAAGPQVDVANLIARARVAQYDQIVNGWLVANFADNLNVPGLPARYSYVSWNMRDVMTQANSGSFPLLVTPLVGPVSTQVASSSGNYFRLTRNAASPPIQLRMLAPAGTNLSSEYATLIVARLN